jgi:hypothetical protein
MSGNGLFLSAILAATLSYSQPSITGAGVNPVIGEHYTKIITDYFSPGASGTSQTWNFSSLSGVSEGVTYVVHPDSTEYGDSFPYATVALKNTYRQSVIYLRCTSSLLQRYGLITAGYTREFGTNPEDLLHFTMNYNDSFVDSFAVYGDVSGARGTSISFNRIGVVNVKADAYGTLTTPAGTFTNVLRIHINESYSNTYTGFPDPQVITNDEYQWFKNGFHFPLATVHTLTYQGPDIKDGSYITNPTGVDSSYLFFSPPILFPNPASNEVDIEFALNNYEEVTAKLFDASTKEVLTKTISGVPGDNIIPLRLDQIPVGIYYAIFSTNSFRSATKKLVVIR